jgi:hypothetical protein
MATRKVKHARALAKREEFFKTVHQGNQEHLRKVQMQRDEQAKREAEERKQQKIEKSKRLAKAHSARPQAPAKKENN